MNLTVEVMPTASLLGIAFVVLKLCGVIAWSWWWVTLPFWGGIALVLAVLPLGAMAIVAFHVVRHLVRRGLDGWATRRRNKKDRVNNGS
jgi:membrane protein YdbS with pleckstrin-like domain